MQPDEAKHIIEETFNNPFDKARFLRFIKNLLNDLNEAKAFDYHGAYIPETFRDYVRKYKRLGQYTDPEAFLSDLYTFEMLVYDSVKSVLSLGEYDRNVLVDPLKNKLIMYNSGEVRLEYPGDSTGIVQLTFIPLYPHAILNKGISFLGTFYLFFNPLYYD